MRNKAARSGADPYFDPRDPNVDAAASPVDPTQGWQSDRFREITRLSLFATPDGKRAAFVRLPERRVAVIILSDRDDLDGRTIAEGIISRLLSARP